MFLCPPLCGLFSFIVPTKVGISYYTKKSVSYSKLQENGHICCTQIQQVGVKLFAEVSALLLLSRFPDSWIFALPFLLVPFLVQWTYMTLLPKYSDRIVQVSHLIPFSSMCIRHRTLNSPIELYNRILLFS